MATTRPRLINRRVINRDKTMREAPDKRGRSVGYLRIANKRA